MEIAALPEPEVDWSSFSTAISALNDRTPLVWDPITKKMKKWIDMQKLNAIYGKDERNIFGSDFRLSVSGSAHFLYGRW